MEFTDCGDGWSLDSTKYTRMELSGFSFTALSDVMRALETTTNIDDEATSCIGVQLLGGGGVIENLGNRLWLLVISTASLKIYELKYRQQHSNPFDTRSRTTWYFPYMRKG